MIFSLREAGVMVISTPFLLLLFRAWVALRTLRLSRLAMHVFWAGMLIVSEVMGNWWYLGGSNVVMQGILKRIAILAFGFRSDLNVFRSLSIVDTPFQLFFQVILESISIITRFNSEINGININSTNFDKTIVFEIILW